MNTELIQRLDRRATAAGIPVVGTSRTGFDYAPDATTEQRAAGNAMFAAFDPVAEQAAIEAEQLASDNDRKTYRNAKATALTRLQQINDTKTTMTAAQVRDAVGDMALVLIRLIKAQGTS